MSPIEHVWDALDRCIRQSVSVPANIQQLLTAIEEEWTNIPQSTTWSTLCEGDVLHCVRQMLVTPDTNWFPPTPNTVKLHILEWPCIVASLRHTCALIMLSNQHLDMTHLRWMDYLGKGEVLTNTDLNRFVNNIWDKEAFCAHRKKFNSWKMGAKKVLRLYFCSVYFVCIEHWLLYSTSS